jgi:hypothetical protein
MASGVYVLAVRLVDVTMNDVNAYFIAFQIAGTFLSIPVFANLSL